MLIRLYLVSGTFLYVTMEEPLGEAGRGGVCLFLAARLLSNAVAADACAHEAEEERKPNYMPLFTLTFNLCLC